MNRIFRTLILSVLTISTTYAQGSIEDIIVGQWKTVEPSGDTLILNFDKNKTMYMKSKKFEMGKGEVITKDGQKVKSLMKYELNTKENPSQLNFFMFVDNFYNPVNRSEGIIEILNINMLRMAMSFIKNEKRPSDFTNKIQTRILFRTETQNEVTDCQKFKDGKFRNNDPVLGETSLVRKGSNQEETHTKGSNYKFKVNWTGPCGYELFQMKTFTNNAWVSDTTGLVTTIDILHTRRKSYIYVISYNKSKFKFFGELTKTK